MHVKTKNDWLCLYIYVKPPCENLLVYCLLPIIEELSDAKKINKFFFIRYGEDGYHIRFRIQFNEINVRNIFEPIIIQKILFFIYDNKLSYSSLDGTYIHLTKYEPETTRYGGKYGIRIAEQIFHSSSITVLNIIKSMNPWNYHAMLIHATIINYTMIYLFTLNNRIVSDFFFLNYQGWVADSISKIKGESTLSNSEISLQYHQYYHRQFNFFRNEIIPIIKNYYIQLKSKVLTDVKYANWMEGLVKTNDELSIIVTQKRIQFRKLKNNVTDLQNIYESYVHMNNNRLGITNKDESVVSYLIFQSVNEIMRNE